MSGLCTYGPFSLATTPEYLLNATLLPTKAKSGTGVKIGLWNSIIWTTNPCHALASAEPPHLSSLRFLPPLVKTSNIKVFLQLLFSIIAPMAHLKRHTNYQSYYGSTSPYPSTRTLGFFLLQQ